MARPLDRHARIFFGVLLTLLAGLAAFNVVLDPFRAHRVLEIDALRPYRDELVSRIAKAELLVRDDCRLVIVGTSRAQIALDPEHPAWGMPACNLSLTGLGAPELLRVIERVIREPRVRELVIAIDFISFSGYAPFHEEFARSRFDPGLDPVEYHASLLFGEDATRASLRLLSDYRQGQVAAYTERGLTDPARLGRSADRESFLWSLDRIVPYLAGTGAEKFRYDGQCVPQLAALVRQAQARGIAATVVILPAHAVHMEALRRFGHWPSYERWKADLASAFGPGSDPALAPPWDFTSYAGPMAEAIPLAGAPGTIRWHWDSVHVKREVGDEVIAQIRRSEPPRHLVPGIRLTRAALPVLAERLDAERQQYLRARPADPALIDEARRRTGILGPSASHVRGD